MEKRNIYPKLGKSIHGKQIIRTEGNLQLRKVANT